MNGYDSHTEEKYEWGRVFFQTSGTSIYPVLVLL
jgi:hypothetical protein